MISRVAILCVFSALCLAVVAAGAAREVENRQLTSVVGSIISAGKSDLSSLAGEATSEAGGVFETVTSVGGQAVTIVTSVGGQAITLATSVGGQVTSFAGSEYTIATAAITSATATSDASSPGIVTWPIILTLVMYYVIA